MSDITKVIEANFGATIRQINKKRDSEPKSIVNTFKKGDIIACYAGYPHVILCVVELIHDNPNVDNFSDFISGKSLLPLTSHLISPNWFKIN